MRDMLGWWIFGIRRGWGMSVGAVHAVGPPNAAYESNRQHANMKCREDATVPSVLRPVIVASPPASERLHRAKGETHTRVGAKWDPNTEYQGRRRDSGYTAASGTQVASD